MGAKLANDTNLNVIYVTPKNFGEKKPCGLIEEWRDGMDNIGFKPVEVLNPSTKETSVKLVRRYQSVDGHLVEIKWYDTKDKFKQRYSGFKVYLRDGELTIVIVLPYRSRALDQFALFAPNINFDLSVTFFAFPDEKDGHIVFIAKQDNQTVKKFFTKDNMGDCPPATHDEHDGWDFKAQRKYLAAYLIQEVTPRIDAANERRQRTINPVMAAQAPFVTDEAKNADASTMTDDDIPF